MAKTKQEPEVKKPEVKKVKTIEDFYSIGKWKGFDQFKCKVCKFDSLEEQAIKDHIKDVHMPKPVKPKVEIKLYDRNGNEIIKK